MEILSFAIQKGGAGKTTTAVSLVQVAKSLGKKVLAIDLDPQANLSIALASNTDGKGSFELLNGDTKVIQTTSQGIDVISANLKLSTITSFKGSARRLANAIEPIKDNYDLIVIDTPPTAGELQYNSLMASTGLIIPLVADIYNLQGLYQIVDTARMFQKSNPNLTIKGFIFTQYDNRSIISRQMKETITIKANSLNVPYLGTIRAGAVIKETSALQVSLYDYAPNSKPALDYLEVYNNLNL